jgi:hypothetical protein
MNDEDLRSGAPYKGAQVTFIKEPRRMSEAEVDALLERARNLPPIPHLPAAVPARSVDYSPRDAQELAHTEAMAEQGVLVRHGIGQVLGVR